MADGGITAHIQLGAVNPQTDHKFNERKAREAAESFEAVFLAQVLNTMFSGIESGGMMGSGPEAQIYQSMMNEQVAAVIARQGGIGIADQVYREILKIQEFESAQE